MIIIKLYAGINVKDLKLLGSGTQGKVYKIDTQKCIKVFKRKQICGDEIETLVMAQKDSHFPRIYAFGEDYIIREYIDGIELDKYLSNKPLSKNISNKIIELYKAMEFVGFKRLDAAPFHIFLTPLNEIRLIDTARAMKKTTIYPSLIIQCLADFQCKEEFLNYVREINPELFKRWHK